MSTYLVKEIFGPTIQGEGAHAGCSCVFLRFAVCNLACSWCDTDFDPAGAEELDIGTIVRRLLVRDAHRARTVVVTGGEPTLQWDPELARALGAAGFRVHMESNGTRALKAPVDWLTISPKPQFHDGRFHLLSAPQVRPDECKVVVDDSVDGATLARYERHYDAAHFFVQPCAGDDYQRSVERALALVRERPRWRLSVQLHKLVGVP